MTRKPTSLDAALAKKAVVATAASPLPPASAGSGEIRTLTLRLPPVVHDQLREMAFTSRRSQHALLLEALNDLFQKHGKPPIAV
jgi:hypothetical protein